MTNSGTRTRDVALIVGGGPGISASCARLFAAEGMRVAIAARSPDKPVLKALEEQHGARLYACDASKPEPRRTIVPRCRTRSRFADAGRPQY